MIEKLVIATRNPAKIEYYQQLFCGIVKNIISLNDIDVDGKPQEIGDTAEENAIIKAKYYSTKTSLPVFCEDESLFVDFLPSSKQPGTHVRRINGHNDATDEELFFYWENIIKDIPSKKRTGCWHIAYCLSVNGQFKTVALDHPVLFYYPASKIRIPGWPMSSLEGPVELGKPHSEGTAIEKNEALIHGTSIILEKLKELF